MPFWTAPEVVHTSSFGSHRYQKAGVVNFWYCPSKESVADEEPAGDCLFIVTFNAKINIINFSTELKLQSGTVFSDLIRHPVSIFCYCWWHGHSSLVLATGTTVLSLTESMETLFLTMSQCCVCVNCKKQEHCETDTSASIGVSVTIFLFWVSLLLLPVSVSVSEVLCSLCLATVGVSITVFWSSNLFLFILDITGRPRFLQKYKIQPDKNVPVRYSPCS